MAKKIINKTCQHCNRIFAGTTNPRDRHCSLSCRFWSKVNILTNDKCWEWNGSKDWRGYGKISINHRPITASRVSWILTYGEIQNRLQVLHKCDNPGCVNPSHLFVGTQRDNIQDCLTKGRFRPGHLYGELNPIAKLSTQDVTNIRHLLLNGFSGVDVAKVYNVTPAAISSIKTKKNWSHI